MVVFVGDKTHFNKNYLNIYKFNWKSYIYSTLYWNLDKDKVCAVYPIFIFLSLSLLSEFLVDFI